MKIDYGVQADENCVKYNTTFASLTLTKRFVAAGRIQAFRKAVKFVSWMYRDDPDALDDALSVLEDVIQADGVDSKTMTQHMEAVNNIRRKYGIQ